MLWEISTKANLKPNDYHWLHPCSEDVSKRQNSGTAKVLLDVTKYGTRGFIYSPYII